jgi:hypothetical protein
MVDKWFSARIYTEYILQTKVSVIISRSRCAFLSSIAHTTAPAHVDRRTHVLREPREEARNQEASGSEWMQSRWLLYQDQLKQCATADWCGFFLLAYRASPSEQNFRWSVFASQARLLFLVDLAVPAYTFNQTERQNLITSVGDCDGQVASILSVADSLREHVHIAAHWRPVGCG